MSVLSNKSNPHAISRRRFTQAAALGAGSVLFSPALLRAQGTGVIKITNVQGITGPSAAYGIRSRDGALLALDDINKLGFKDASGKSYTFEMSKDFIPWRRNVSFLKAREVPIEPLLEGLTFIKDKKNWGFPFRRGSFEISRPDFELIAKNMGVLK